MHGVEPERYDLVVGNYPFIPPWNALEDAQLPRHRGVWRIGHPGLEPYLVSGFSRSQAAERRYRWTTAPSATVLVPNLMPYGQRLTLWLAPGGARHAVLRFNGDVVATAELVGWTPVTFDLPHIPLHTNELTIEATPGAPATTPGGVPPDYPVGVAVGDLELRFLPR